MISNLAKLKKMHQEKPWLYEEEEHAVLKLAEDAEVFIRTLALSHSSGDAHLFAKQWLEEHK